VHRREQHPAPLDPNFTGAGRTLTDENGEYLFTTIKPGPYPWGNHVNAWRPAHIHFSLFGSAFTQRLVTQMYFPGDPLFVYDPIFQSVTDPVAQQRLIAVYEHERSVPEYSLGFRFDVVLDGPSATYFEEESR
jgi:protocatechuate 3,4-dioxygenase beta subunit